MSWERDFLDAIDLAKVRTPDVPQDWRSTKSYSRAEIENAAVELGEIHRLTRENGLRKSDFEAMRQSDDPKQHGLGVTYHKFYNHENSGTEMNHDFLVVDFVGDHYEITNGQHRIAELKRQGISHAPALVSAPDRDTLERLKKESARLGGDDVPRRGERQAPWDRKDERHRDQPQTRERK